MVSFSLYGCIILHIEFIMALNMFAGLTNYTCETGKEHLLFGQNTADESP